MTPLRLLIHPSQFPDAVRAELNRSLRERAINHKFHYETHKQAEKWLALHEAYSPARTDPDGVAIYDASFAAAAATLVQYQRSIHLIGLGCGGGQKEARLLRLLSRQTNTLRYTPVDVSPPLVIAAALTAYPIANESAPIVCDLQLAADLDALLNEQIAPDATRCVTFFGMIPNFEPELILPRLAQLTGSGDLLLFGANLAPRPDYRRGIEQVKPLYDNDLTRDWLMIFLLDLGIERSDGQLQWSIEGEQYLRLEAGFLFHRDRTISVGGAQYSFSVGDRIRLFFSYRYTPELISTLLKSHGFTVEQEWITNSDEEGVFLCRKC